MRMPPACKIDRCQSKYAGDVRTYNMRDESLEEFREQCKRNLLRSVEDRMRYGFNYVYKPVLDDADWRSFESMEEYRQWCRENLPEYLGYGELSDLQRQVLNET